MHFTSHATAQEHVARDLRLCFKKIGLKNWQKILGKNAGEFWSKEYKSVGVMPSNLPQFYDDRVFLQGYCEVVKKISRTGAECEGPPKNCGGGSQCSANAECRDETNSGDDGNKYNCACKPGFEGDGRTCQRRKAFVIHLTI